MILGLNQFFTAELIATTAYDISSTTNSVQVEIVEDDIPSGIAILPLSPWVSESQQAQFFVISPDINVYDIIVNISVNQTGNYIHGIIPESIEILAELESTAIVTFDLIDDHIAEEDGQIEVVLESSDLYPIDTEYGRATIQIRDNDNPTLSIRPVQNGFSSFNRREGQPANFEIISSKTLSKPTFVNLQVTESNDVLEGLTPIRQQILISELTDSTIISIDTIDDTIIEDGSVVSATLLPSAGFIINETAKNAQITVFDNEPTIAVHADSSNIAWGEDVRFTFSIEDDVNDITLVERELEIEITQSGDSFMGPLPTNVTLPTGATSVTLSISSPRNTINISDYQIIALIKSHNQYRVSSSSNSATVTMVEHPPIASISSLTSESQLGEGETIDLLISLSRPLNYDTDVVVNLVDTQEFLVGPTTRTVTIPAESTATEFTIETISDSRRSRDGRITAELQSHSALTIDPQANSESFTVLDDDWPRISISAIDPIITEGQPARFRLQTTRQAEFGFDVSLITKNIAGNFFSSEDSIIRSIGQRTTEATFSLATQNVSGFNPIGTVAVEVRDGLYYNASFASDNQASVQVVDADHPTGISIIAVDSTIFEGETAEFQIIAETPVNQATSVSVQIFNPLNLITSKWFESVIIPANQYSTSLRIQTNDNDVANTSQLITANLISAEGFTIDQSPQYSASISVYDNEEVEVAISAGDPIIAGSDAQFELTTNFAPEQDLYILVDISDGDRDIILGSRASTVLISAGTQTALIDISTTIGNELDGSGTITATILPGLNYRIAPAPNNSVNVDVTIFSGYELSISPFVNGSVGSGGSFNIKSNKPLLDNLFVNILVEESSPGLIRGRIPSLVVIEKNRTQNNLYVRIADEITDLSNATITATIIPGDGYSIAGGGNNSASISIVRYPPPIVSLRKVTDTRTIAELESAAIEFELSNPTVEDLEIEFHRFCQGISCTNLQFNNITAQSVTNSSVVIAAGQTSARISIEITEDTDLNFTTYLKLELSEDSAYYINYLEESISYVVSDSILTGTISVYEIDKVGQSIVEGDDLTFNIITDTPVNQDRVIRINITQRGDYIAGIQPTSVILPAGAYAVPVIIATDDDAIFESRGVIRLELLSGEGYVLDSENDSDQVFIDDNEGSEFSISKQTEPVQIESIIREGDDLRIAIESTFHYSDDKTIELLITETGNILDPTMVGQYSYTFPKGKTRSELVVKTLDDSTPEPDSSITVSFLPSDYVLINPRESEVTFLVEDNEPQLHVRPVSTAITEGEIAEFEVSFARGTFGNIASFAPIEYEISQHGNFVQSPGLGTTQMWWSEQRKVIEIPTIDDRDKEVPGSVTLTLIPNEWYSVAQSGGIATISITDDEPEISIAVTEGSDIIDKGGLVNFEISSAEPRLADTTIMVNLLDPGNNVIGELAREILMSAGESKVILSVQTQRNENTAGDSEIVAELISNQHYSLNSDAKKATVTVLDLDRPRISLSTETPIVTEGEDIEIEISASTITPITLPINLLIEENNGDFIDLRSLIVENINAFTDSTSFVIATLDDEVDEYDGSISISVLDRPSYNPSYLAAENMITVEIQDNDLPEISIMANDNLPITEGETAQFLINSSVVMLETLTIQYQVDGTGNFFPSGTIGSADIEDGSDSVALEFSIPDNDDFETSGAISISLIPAAEYQILDGLESASIAIEDNDVPEGISILLTGNSEILEGSRARFLIISNEISEVDRELLVEISETGEFIDEHWETVPISIKAGHSSAVLTIPTIDDEVYEKNGLVLAKLSNNHNYSITKQYHEAVVSVLDNDVPSGVSIVSLTDTVNEGEIAEFQIAASTTFAQSRTINLNVEQIGDFVNDPLPTEVVIDAYHTTTKLRIPTLSNQIQDSDGSITATVESGTNYRVATSVGSSATITIRNDDRPSIQITGDNIVEDENAVFTLTSSIPAGYPFNVNLKVTEVGDFINTEYPQMVTFDTGETTVDLILNIDDDDVDEENGEIQVTLLRGEDYLVTPEPDHTAAIEVTDNDDPPIISLSAVPESLIEGESSVIEILATRVAAEDLEIQVDIEDIGHKFTKGRLSRNILLVAGTTSTSFELQTNDDNVYESDEIVTVSLQSGDGYEIANVTK